MDSVLYKAYEIMFGSVPSDGLPDWKIAESILDSFNVPLLGEDLAKHCILRIVNHVDCPDQPTTTRIVGRAESYATELWDDLSDEPHMAEIEVKEYEYYQARARLSGGSKKSL